MKMEQMIARLLAEKKSEITNQAKADANVGVLKEEIRAGQEHLKKEIVAKIETNQEKMDAKIDANQEMVEARIDAKNEKFVVLGGGLVSRTDIHEARTVSTQEDIKPKTDIHK
jgi:hypothetical protein